MVTHAGSVVFDLTGARMEIGPARRALTRLAVVTTLALVGSGAAIGTAHASDLSAAAVRHSRASTRALVRDDAAATSFGPH